MRLVRIYQIEHSIIVNHKDMFRKKIFHVFLFGSSHFFEKLCNESEYYITPLYKFLKYKNVALKCYTKVVTGVANEI